MASTFITSQQLADIARHDPDQLVRVSYTNVYNGRKYTFRDTAANVVRELPRNAAISKSKIRRNPVTRAPDSIWSEAQRKAGKRVLQDGRVITEVDVWEHGTVRLTVATEESQGSTWWYWILSDGKKIAGFGSAIQKDRKLLIENSWIAKNLRGMGLYQSSIKALRQASGMPVASARTRSKAADRSWRQMGASFDEGADRWEINPQDDDRFYRYDRYDLTLTIDTSATYNGVDGIEWVLHRGAKEVGTGLALKARISGKWVYQIAGARLDPDLQGQRLYPDWILPAIRSAAGAPLRSGSNRSEGAERAWSRAKGAEMVAGDEPRGYEHDWQINPPRPMTYAAAHAWERQAAERGVSKVARSARGFMRAYQAAGTFANLSAWWKRRRAGFIARHMAQAGRGDRLWEHVGGRWRPTRRGLALIMWAFLPPGRPRSR